MSSFQRISFIGMIVGVALILSTLPVAQSQTTAIQIDQPNGVLVAYVAPK